MSAAKTIYKPLSIASSVAGGMIAGQIFQQIWQRISPDDEEPDPKDLSRSTREVFIAAAIQGLLAGVVRAALARGQAKGFAALTDEDLD
ncbi:MULTISPECIES: DUF4235 domain-containing protein [unclassified Mycobacterium]|uniref:DUF4235 domain-containing protein n=1 Tax=Mycobacteriaceae TaxID=1762 RepID=UPI0007FCAD72|nr:MULTISPECIES: DUF4235 domain-containing protein [unclassified Mycobacterium]OBB47604.1 hypothetical protein A5752_23435 [Mycobacterium sp. 852002-51961_SCH5331710]OBG96940.1 hypothetical protein A5698_13755 [Mycobacterium sp. E136]OBK77516.1 hypothetical protein A5650_13820 [Mycobacterium sp. 1164985.4]